MVEILSAEEARDIHLKTNPELAEEFNKRVRNNEDGFEVENVSMWEQINPQLYTWILRNKKELVELGYTIKEEKGYRHSVEQWSPDKVHISWHKSLQ